MRAPHQLLDRQCLHSKRRINMPDMSLNDLHVAAEGKCTLAVCIAPMQNLLYGSIVTAHGPRHADALCTAERLRVHRTVRRASKHLLDREHIHGRVEDPGSGASRLRVDLVIVVKVVVLERVVCAATQPLQDTTYVRHADVHGKAQACTNRCRMVHACRTMPLHQHREAQAHRAADITACMQHLSQKDVPLCRCASLHACSKAVLPL